MLAKYSQPCEVIYIRMVDLISTFLLQIGNDTICLLKRRVNKFPKEWGGGAAMIIEVFSTAQHNQMQWCITFITDLTFFQISGGLLWELSTIT